MPRFPLYGREHQDVRETAHAFVNRKRGDSDTPYLTVGEQQGERDAHRFEELPVVFLLADDGSYWNPQSADGSFPYLPGYDGPVKEEGE